MFSGSQVTQVQVTSLKIHSGNGGSNRPVFNLRDQFSFLELFPQIHSGNGGINRPASFHKISPPRTILSSIKICILES